MRMRLYLDPEVVIGLTEEDEYPTIRQIIDEISSAGNVDVCLFSSTEDSPKFEKFIKDYNLEGLVLSYQRGLDILDNSESDIVADVREEVLGQTTSIRLFNNLLPLVKWFVPQSRLLDPIYRELNSGRFINAAEGILDYIGIQGELDKEYSMDYLGVEHIYRELLEIMEENPALSVISKYGFTIKKVNDKYQYEFEG